MSGRRIYRYGFVDPVERTRGAVMACTRCDEPFPAWTTVYVPVAGGTEELCWHCWQAWKLEAVAKQEAA